MKADGPRPTLSTETPPTARARKMDRPPAHTRTRMNRPILGTLDPLLRIELLLDGPAPFLD